MVPHPRITLRFYVPLIDGSAFLLFPGSKHVRVTPNNYESFTYLLACFHQCFNVAVRKENNGYDVTMPPAAERMYTDRYVERALPHLPLNALRNLYNDDYAEILYFVRRHLLQKAGHASLWSLERRRTEEQAAAVWSQF
ncbi:hypothetical protein STCU_10719 [Strigomonas culicis]|uniref:Uncharacterized protein n=1 Tax=Strigomonas culicis TaxID=28005 RepID=S9V360_9TRYP|nr:hypothetical protein STCU_10719 [Strigomonas culicis]|eukprot:EPY17265.1 hypothetical protein STCU_10719 [Strigomonas culicis]